MKNLIIIFFAVSLIFCFVSKSYGMDFYFLNINLKWLKDAEPRDYVIMGLGAGASFFSHELAHIAYLEYLNADYTASINPLHGGVEIFYRGLTPSQQDMFSNIGFAVQSLSGLFLTSFEKTRHSYFTRGWIGIETLQLGRYATHLHSYGDFVFMENRDLIFGLHSAINVHNTLRQRW